MNSYRVRAVRDHTRVGAGQCVRDGHANGRGADFRVEDFCQSVEVERTVCRGKQPLL